MLKTAAFRHLALLSGFVTARGLQMLGPITAATLLPLEAYGAVEWAHAGATMLTNASLLGVASLVPLYLIETEARGRTAGTVRAACSHSLLVALACLIVAVGLAAVVGTDRPAVLLPTLAGLLASHSVLISALRSTGRMIRALYFEALPFTLLAVCAIVMRLFGVTRPINALTLTLGAAALILLALSFALQRHWSHSALRWSDYVDTLRAGAPIMCNGFVAVAATSVGRFGCGALAGAETGGSFAAIARIAALGIVAHQFIVIAKYRDSYAVQRPMLQRIGVVTNACVAASCVALLIAMRLPVPLFGPTFARALAVHPESAVWLVAQVIVWSGTSINETLALRCGVIGRSAVLSAIALSATTLAAMLALRGSGDVVAFARWHTVIMISLFIAQMVSLSEYRGYFKCYWCMVGISFAVVLLFGWLLLVRLKL